ncbi:MAG TPA: DUF3105 domain-containing protein [Actinomycetes bacterium]|nr:DUF3105 domain-containing protein [Actinomycetes bacterium]
MGSNAQRRREARERVAEMRREDAAKQRRRNTLFGIGLVMLVVVAVGGIAWAVKVGTDQAAEPAVQSIDGVKTYNYTAQEHTNDPVNYAESPPVGGPHNPLWQTCGIYDAPIPNENAVHSMEHGAVWITYDPSLSKAEVARLTTGLDPNYLLVSPYPGLDAPVVASAWNTQLKLSSVDDPRLAAFITKYRQGPQTPEPGASCSNGNNTTIPESSK